MRILTVTQTRDLKITKLRAMGRTGSRISSRNVKIKSKGSLGVLRKKGSRLMGRVDRTESRIRWGIRSLRNRLSSLR